MRGLRFTMLGGKPQWGGYDGCNWWGGDVNLAADGAFSTSSDSTTLVGCLDALPPSSVGVVRHATQVRLVDGRLSFYGPNRLLGTFIRVSAGH